MSDYQTQIDAANKTISDFTSKQEGVIDKAKDLTQPFRADYETGSLQPGRIHGRNYR